MDVYAYGNISILIFAERMIVMLFWGTERPKWSQPSQFLLYLLFVIVQNSNQVMRQSTM